MPAARAALDDGSGSVRALADAGASLTDTYQYDAWGGDVAVSGTNANPYRYRGERLESATGLYALRARLRSGHGAFPTRDPADGGAPDDARTLHRYAYANEDPVDFMDPTGETSLMEQLTALKLEATLLATRVVSAASATCAAAGTLGVIQDIYVDQARWPTSSPADTPQDVLPLERAPACG